LVCLNLLSELALQPARSLRRPDSSDRMKRRCCKSGTAGFLIFRRMPPDPCVAFGRVRCEVIWLGPGELVRLGNGITLATNCLGIRRWCLWRGGFFGGKCPPSLMTRGELLRPILIIFPRTLRTAATGHASHAVAMLFQYRRHGLVMRRPPKNPHWSIARKGVAPFP
jgi:hypothetical protein